MSPRKRVPKAKTERNHAISRLRSRFGISISRTQYDDIVSSIQSGEAEFIDRQSNRVSRFLVRAGPTGTLVVAVYDRNRKTVVTFLTLDMLDACGEHSERELQSLD